MAFGKKKEKKKNQKKNRDVAVKAQMVKMEQNPLYPEKQESTKKEVLTALGTAAACLVLVGVIVMNFSYGVTGAQAYDDSYTYDSTEDTTATDETVTDESQDVGTGTVVGESESAEEMQDGTVAETQDYILADSNSRYISTSDLEGLTKEELSYARNEIYARHGRRFKDEGLQSYFDSKDWYEGTISPDDFRESMLNDYEIKNAETILSYEKSKGYR